MLGFVALLLTMRLDEIAHFTALGAPLTSIALFVAYQIPYILPIALPLSCLISSYLLAKRFSSSHEWTALRACGFSLSDLFAPIIVTASFLALLNFWIISEVATRAHLRSNLLKSELRSVNPLLLLHNKHLMRLKGFYFTTLGNSHVGESAENVLFAMPNHNQGRINLMMANQLQASPSVLLGKEVTVVAAKPRLEFMHDDLIIEHSLETLTNVDDFSKVLQRKVWSINNDYLPLPLLIIRIGAQKAQLLQAKFEGKALKPFTQQINRSLSEIAKRISLSLAVISLTLMGIAFGMQISRQNNKRKGFFVIALTLIYLMSFFVAKGSEHYIILSSLLYFLPLGLIALFSLITLQRINQGREGC
ncbi:MAG: LptF/LptG family permease [Parachlamydia sp.]|nr:LptF/LptG family permease [Parachlamydia sp.]